MRARPAELDSCMLHQKLSTGSVICEPCVLKILLGPVTRLHPSKFAVSDFLRFQVFPGLHANSDADPIGVGVSGGQRKSSD
jgi:hypothetical protein